jgi:hypothetical protein
MNQAFLYKIINNNAYTFYDYTKGDNYAKAQLKLPGALGTNPPSDCDRVTAAAQFFLKDRYSIHRFQGILPDTGASEILIAGKEQFLADADMPFVAPETMVERNRLWQRWIM